VQLDLFATEHNLEPGDTKKCRVCGEVKNIKSFPGVIYVRPECNSCGNKNSKLRAALKKDNPYPDDKYTCPICEKNKEDLEHLSFSGGNTWVLDHCWETSEFRGYLCQRCNMGLGQLQDNITSLKRAIKYLLQSKEEKQ
jgi:hypothetical protein